MQASIQRAERKISSVFSVARWVLALLVLGLPVVSSAQVTYEQKSDPAGLFTTTTVTKNLNESVSTSTPSLSVSGHSFTHWTVNGARENAPDGQAKNKVNFTITENTVAIAHYLETSEDSDSDGVPDWFEIRMFGTLAHDESYDGDADGVTLADERKYGLAATIADDFLEGGASIRRSSLVFANFGGAKNLSVSSDPAGLFTTSKTFPETNSSYTSSNLSGATNGYYFSHWEVNGVRQADATGLGLSRISLTMDEDKTVVAKYFHQNEDNDTDGLPDWFEWHEFGTLDHNSSSDPDGDGLLMSEERQFGLSAVIADDFLEGGASIRRSSLVFANFGGAKKLSVSSDPAGLFTSSETFPETNSSYTSSNLSGAISGYYFSHWEVNGVRQGDATGLGLSRVSLTMDEDKTVVAKYYHQNEDNDTDGLPDWFEWHEFGTLDHNSSSDPDGDGMLMSEERQFGLSAVIADDFLEGGGSIRRSGTFGYIEFQPNEDDDGDGLTKAQELQYGTSDDNTDSDGDGFSDGEEVTAGSDPAKADSVPNRPPRDLNSTAVLAFQENQPVGTIIGEFNGTDPDGHAITYSLVPFSPAQVSPTLWLDASEEATLVKESGALSTWLDKSGNNRNGSSTGSSRPSISTGYNGNTMINLDGVDDIVSINGSFALNTFFVVLNSEISSEKFSNWAWVLGARGPDKTFQMVPALYGRVGGSSLTTELPFQGNQQSFISINGDDTLSHNTKDFGNFSEFKLISVSSNQSSSNLSNWKISSGEFPWKGNIAEIVAFDRPLKDHQRYSMEEYLSSKWGLSSKMYRPYVPSNSLFTLDTNGTLKTATTFDYESNASSYIITIQAKDELNATTEGNFTVTLLDVYEPSRQNHTVELNATVGLEMIWVEPGTFMMGSPTSEAGRSNNEGLKSVNIPRGFFLGKYELTQAQYEAVMKGNTFGLSPNPSARPNKPNFPVERVSSNHTQTFLEVLNKKQKDSGSLTYRWKYVLPTEAQWEYACRAGTSTAFSWGDSINSQHANYNDNIGRPVNVGQYEPNHWGFYDMHGNIYEWVSDRLISASKASARGGSYKTNYSYTRSAHRSAHEPTLLSERIGIRLAYEYIPNSNPSNLSSSHSLAFNENQPVGTTIGEFNATDPDGDAITYHFVNGENDNSLFTLDTNGTLKTATTFDYESNASSYTITLQAKDELNATTEGNFTVTLLDVYEDTDRDGFRDSLEATTGSNLNDPNSTPLQQGLVAWYPFDGNASDMSGNGNHGTVNGATLGTDRHGVAGKAYSFDGVDDRIELDRGNILGDAQELTLSAWIKTSFEDGGPIFGEFAINSTNQYQYTRNFLSVRSNLAINFDQFPPSEGISEEARQNYVLTDSWNHITYSRNGGFWYITIGSSIVSSGSQSENYNGPTPQSAWIGARKYDVDNPTGIHGLFEGSIDDIRIYDRALSADEIELLYRAESPNHFVDSAKDLEMIWVEPGTFTMGQTGVAEPEHNVTLTEGFYLGKYEVTQAQYEAVMLGNDANLSATPSKSANNPNRPVEKVSWIDVQVFLARLNEKQADSLPDGWAYVLPTEAQWEYACRAATTTAYSWGDTISPTDANWDHGNDANQTENVGQYSANPWGFFDMHGNVWEWTADAYHSYAWSAQTDPFNDIGSSRILRGGSFANGNYQLKSSRRFNRTPSDRPTNVGFRLALRDLNKAPTDLKSTAVLAFQENLSVGTVIGEFNATDPDGDAITYNFVNGENNNSLFTLDTNGTLKTAATFDYETNASSYIITIQAKDELNATTEGNFTVTLLDVYEDTDGDGFRDSLEASTGSNLNDPNSTPLQQGLVAWYPFDGNASDMSGNGNHGTVNGATLGTDRHGVSGKAYSFDGVDDFIKTSNNESILSLTESLTLSVWIATRSKSTGSVIYKNKNLDSSDNDDNYWLRIFDSRIDFRMEDASDDHDYAITSSKKLNTTNYRHLLCIFNGSKIELFIDAQLNASIGDLDFTPYSGPGGLQIGSNSLSNHGSGSVSYFDGSIDDIRIYNRALSADEIELLYRAESPNHFVDSAKDLEMIWVEPGTFTMGSPESETGRSTNETEHNVTLTKGFYLGKYEVTQAQYEDVMQGNTNTNSSGDVISATPSNFAGNPNRPVERVSWEDIQVFLTRLNEQQAENLPSGWAYVLPTEAQWEYACRAGTTTAYPWGDTISASDANWNHGDDANETGDVGQYAANPWGFFDMIGNVSEWTADAWGAYESGDQTDPFNAGTTGSNRVWRGGSWYNSAPYLRSATRSQFNRFASLSYIGFRLGLRDINKAPTDLNSTAVLSFHENQPVGTVIGELNATDPDADAITYHFVNGENNNSLFTLDTNGTLKTATTFDYESNASTYTITVQAKDELNATTEGNFTVTLLDDKSDNPPSDLWLSNAQINENTGLGTEVAQIVPLDKKYAYKAGQGIGSHVVILRNASHMGVQFIKGEVLNVTLIGNGGTVNGVTIYRPQVNKGPTWLPLTGRGDWWERVFPGVSLILESGNEGVSLDGQTGMLSVNRIFDYETDGASHSFSVRAEREGMHDFNKSFTLAIKDIFEDLDKDGTPNHLDDDIDGDGFTNKEELAFGSDPLDAESLINRNPEDITMIGGRIKENEPVGTVVARFLGVDADGNESLTYILAGYSNEWELMRLSQTKETNESKEENPDLKDYNSSTEVVSDGNKSGNYETPGDSNNSTFSSTLDKNTDKSLSYLSPFILSPRGVLRTNRLLDFERDPSLHYVKIRVVDEYNASIDRNFSIRLVNVIEDSDGDGTEDAFDEDTDGDGFSNQAELAEGTNPKDKYSYPKKPILETAEALFDENGSFILRGSVLENGQGKITDFGFVLSSGISLDKEKSTVYWIRGEGIPKGFRLNGTESPFENVMYFRAWAKNVAGYGIGPVKKISIPEAPQLWWGDVIERPSGWKTSDWFGTFKDYEQGWIYHARLGWLYASAEKKNGVWLWKDGRGWLWTNQSAWPYLWWNKSKNWLYLVPSKPGERIRFYDYSTESYR